MNPPPKPPVAPPGPAPGLSKASRAVLRLQEIGRVLAARFLGKDEIIRLVLLSAVAGEHMVIIGPPGTAKSALVRLFARLVDARYFEYLLTRFSEPNELLGPVDIRAFREGSYRRRTEHMLPEAEVVFLDEIFKANSAILNSLLTLLNERRVHIGGQRLDVPLITLLGASNEMPADEGLAALLDRFLLRVRSDNLDSFHMNRLIAVGLAGERLAAEEAEAAAAGPDGAQALQPLLSAGELRELRLHLQKRLHFSEEFLARYKSLVMQIRGEGVSLSDRRVVRLLKLCAASALLDAREQADESDLFVLKHIWNTPEQAEILNGLITPVVDRYYRANPGASRRTPGAAGLDDLLKELAHVRELLGNAQALSDVQLFAQLRNLGELRAALAAIPSEASQRVLGEIDQLLDGVFSASRFG